MHSNIEHQFSVVNTFIFREEWKKRVCGVVRETLFAT